MASKALLGVVAAVASFSALAAPEEIQVFVDDIAQPGEPTLAVHGSYVFDGPREPGHPGARISHRTLRLMPEIAWNIGPGWETAVHFPLATSRDGSGKGLSTDGFKWRAKYVSPDVAGKEWFWGGNVEVATFAKRLSEATSSLELKAFFGWRDDDWLLAGNLNFGRPMSGDVEKKWELTSSWKLAREVSDGVRIGVERFESHGHLSDLGSVSRIHYLVLDWEHKGWAVNFGIGHGSGEDPDKRVVKWVVAIPW